MLKNLTVNRIASIVALLVGIFNCLFFFLVSHFTTQDFSRLYTILCSIGLSIICFIVVKYLLSRFVFKNIQLIYKMIRSTRNLDNNINVREMRKAGLNLNNLDDEVFQWAERTKNEITDLKELESYRRNYLGNVSHELKTPIFSIQGYLHTLIEGGLYDEKINMRYLRKAADNTMRLENIVKDLEAVNRLEADAKLDLKKFDIRELVLEVFQELEIYSTTRDVKFSISEDTIEQLVVIADKGKIRQVLTNLLTNSVKYSDEGGEVNVSFFIIQDSILIEIKDNGIGIEEKHLKHLFDRFYRVDASRSRKFGGSGLGLSIVKHIIEAHNQTINVRSTPGVGSTFAFTLNKAK